MAECRSCGADVTWTVTANAKRMLVDSEPVPNGNVQLYHAPEGLKATVLAGERLNAARIAGAQLHLSHHASCPQGKEWRKK